MGRNFAETAIIFLLAGVIILVFYDINTSMVEQGIAKGDAYQNAAAYPKTIAILLAICIGLVFWGNKFGSKLHEVEELVFDFKHCQLLIVVCIYLYTLDFLGYHLLTPALLFLTSLIYGENKWRPTLIYSVLVSLLIAFIFEELLNVVLPVGIFEIALPVLL